VVSEKKIEKKYVETPLMKQYYSIKAVHPDAILLFRVGDFYETFGDDAIKASGILGITLTRRANGAATYVELAGFPYHAIDTYLPKLVRAGERVAICEQLEDPKLVKGLVKRGVIELVTPGIVLGDNILGTDFCCRLHINRGAGAFVCGEGSALTASIEGKRGMPRVKPPRTVEHGLWEKPTVLNNVETYANVPMIIQRGAEWYRGIGTPESPGTKAFALTGNVCNTGLIEVPMGTPLRDIVFDVGGGIPNGKKFKAVQIGGPSGGCLSEKDLDRHMDFDSLTKIGAMIGSGGMVVMDEDTCMVEVARFLT